MKGKDKKMAEKKIRSIGIVTGGGDAPGMNAAVRAVARAALDNGIKVFGVRNAYKGLVEDDMIELDELKLSNIINRAGTFLYTDRYNKFMDPEYVKKAISVCRAKEIDLIVCIGGDGTFRGATDLSNHGIPCIGIPATIDNDITSTDNTIGFDTAMNTVIDVVDKLRDTCESHARCNVVEVMGRGAGDIALNTAIASGATAAVVPEFPYDDDSICRRIKKGREMGKRNFIIIVSEGVGSEYGPALAKKIEAATGVETKFARLAHIVRGGNPTLVDRVFASKLGVFAVEALLRGESNVVVCERAGELMTLDINFALTMDNMYKNTLKPGQLDKFNEEEIEAMKERIDARTANLMKLYTVENKINI